MSRESEDLARTPSMTLIEFLLQRIAEDEAVATAAVGKATFAQQTGRWSFETVSDQYGPIPIVFAVTDTGAKTQAANMEGAWEREERGAHIARHDPARVLVECNAKRYIVEIHRSWHICPDEDAVEDDDATKPEPCLTLRIAAAVYSDHPDYLPEWQP